MNLKVGQTAQILYWASNGLWEEMATMEISSIDDDLICGVRINRNKEFVKINKSKIREYYTIAEPGESAMHVGEVRNNWYDSEDYVNETKTRFGELFPKYDFLRFDDETCYVVYSKKARKNRLWGHSTYLCGPIDRCPDGGKSWRKWIRPELNKRGIIVIDPLEKPVDSALEDDDSRQERAEWKANGEYDRFSENMKLVRHVDLHLMDMSSFQIAKVDVSLHMAGTYEELFWANRQKKPILIWCPQGVKSIPDWLFGVMPPRFFFDSMESLLEYIDEINSGEQEPDDYGRWLFMDYKKLYGQISPL